MPICCSGTAMVSRMTASRAVDPRNRSLANANPARVEMTTTENATAPDTMNELTSPLTRFEASSLSAVETLAARLLPGVIGGGNVVAADASRLATTIIQ